VTVQFRVTFPNGQGRSATTTTNAAGVARYTYVQAPSKILYKHLFATVLVRASNGAAGTAQTARYRIGWGRIDVAVVPARQIVGRVVTIWVHTRPDTGVGITLQTPNGARAIRLTARTGARGWVHIPYRLGQPFRAATKVLVRAQVQLGGSVYRTRTTLSLTP
jgi:hypothetical protein